MNQEYRRANRMFHLDYPTTGNRGWYFEVRDGQPRGAYASLKLAGMALQVYLSRLEKTHRLGHSRVVDMRDVDTQCQETQTT